MRAGIGVSAPPGGQGAAQPEQGLPCCRRPSPCGAGPGTPGGSPGTAGAPRAGSAWKRGPWSLEAEPTRSQSVGRRRAQPGTRPEHSREPAGVPEAGRTAPSFPGEAHSDAGSRMGPSSLGKACVTDDDHRRAGRHLLPTATPQTCGGSHSEKNSRGHHPAPEQDTRGPSVNRPTSI